MNRFGLLSAESKLAWGIGAACLVLVIVAMIVQVGGSGGGGSSNASSRTEAAATAENYVRAKVLADVRADEPTRIAAAGPQHRAPRLFVLCGDKGSPYAFICDATVEAGFNGATIGKETWAVSVDRQTLAITSSIKGKSTIGHCPRLPC